MPLTATPFFPAPAPAPEITSGKNFFNFLIHLMDVYNCAKGHLPKCIINDFMAVGLIPPPPIPGCTRYPNMNRVKNDLSLKFRDMRASNEKNCILIKNGVPKIIM